MNVHGYLRATRDLDLMLLVEDADITQDLFTQVRSYFRLFDRERVLDDILRAIG